MYLELRASKGRNNSRSNSGSNNRSMQGSLTFPALTMQIAREGAEASWCALQPGNQSQSLIALEVAVQQEEHRQSRLGGLAGERVIKEMNDGGAMVLEVIDKSVPGTCTMYAIRAAIPPAPLSNEISKVQKGWVAAGNRTNAKDLYDSIPPYAPKTT